MSDNLFCGKQRVFGVNDLNKIDFILKNKYAKLSELTNEEVKNLAVIWCYYSGRIEGNTYHTRKQRVC